MKTQHSDNSAHLAETLIESSQVFKGSLLDVRLDRVRLPDGNEATREYVRHQGAVVIIPVQDDGELIFERQFRHPLGRSMIEFPAGKIESGEPVEDTARRELLEETGFIARKWRHIGVMHPCVGYSDERIEIFLARGLEQQGGQNLDQGEFVDLLTLTLEEAATAVREGVITDAKTIAALFWAEKVISSRWVVS
jgi:ADP-ribose pyrophosphatase